MQNIIVEDILHGKITGKVTGMKAVIKWKM